MWFQFNALHWGDVLQTINVSGVDSRQGRIKPIERSAKLPKVQGRGKVNGISGSGGKGGVGNC